MWNECLERDPLCSTYAKFSETLRFILTRVCVRGYEKIVFHKILRTYKRGKKAYFLEKTSFLIKDLNENSGEHALPDISCTRYSMVTKECEI